MKPSLLLAILLCTVISTGLADSQENELQEESKFEMDQNVEDHDKKHDDADKHMKQKNKAGGAHTWSYNLDQGKSGPALWGEIFPDQCGEKLKRQSPINIVLDKTVYNDKLNDIDLLYPPENNTEKHMYLWNNGHAAKVEVKDADLYIVGGQLGDVFKVAQLHFHWGSTEQTGSEHRIDGKQFPLEMHIVTYDSEKYGSLAEAVTGQNSIAVFGTLFKATQQDNQNFNPIVERLKNITQPGRDHMIKIPWVNVRSLLPPVTNKYYRYEGSLTTPTCDQSVLWTVFGIHNYISIAQLKEFRSLIEGTGSDGTVVALEDNWRAPQPINDRKVQVSFVAEAAYEVVAEKNYNEAENTASFSHPFSKLLIVAILLSIKELIWS